MSDRPSAPSLFTPSGAVGPAGWVGFLRQHLLDGFSLVLLALGICWLLFFNEIRGEWEVNAQYSYGYVVPFLAGILFWRRWPDRPAARPSPSPWLTAGVAGLLLLELPFNLIFQANPEWRMLYWANGFQMLALTLALLYRVGGRAWARHFAPPLLFVLIAIPWPMTQEQWVIQNLMRFVAALTVSVVGLLGIPALQHGNLVEVGAGMVGIDEACSGVRSLQSALMLSLFLGEMHRLSHGRRAALLGLSLVFVLIANVTRTSILVWTAARSGLTVMESIHDTVGNVVMFIVLPCLIGMAYLVKPAGDRPAPPAAADPPGTLPPSLPRWPGIAALLWLVVVLAGTEAWYRVHESRLVANTPWHLDWPVHDTGFAKTQISQTSLAILRCNDSQAASWMDADGNNWSAFWLRWQPGRNSEQLAKGHRPDICFPATGAQLISDNGPVTLHPNGVDITFRNQTFSTGAGLLHVFYCLWSDRISPDRTPGQGVDEARAGRLRAVMDGQRNLGQQVIEIVINGPESNADAVKLLTRELPDLLKHG